MIKVINFNIFQGDKKELIANLFKIHKEEMPPSDQMTESCFYDEFCVARTYFLAFEGTEVVGYVGIFDEIDDYSIMGIAVKKEFQRKGVGQLLLKTVIDFARAKGINKLSLEVDETNEKALNFYKKNGFVVTNIRKKYYKNNDAFIMWNYL